MQIDIDSLIQVLIRGLISLFTLFLVTRLIGKKQVSELSLFDYVIGISIGNFAAEITINTDVPLTNGLLAVLLFGIIALIVAKVTMKSIILRRMLTGIPTIIIQNGKFIKENMKKTKYDMNDFLEECRVSGYFDISEIEYAIVEANGKISFLPKSEYKPLTPKDMQVKVKKVGLCANVIIDSKIMIKNLENMGKDKTWLDKELKIKGYKNYDKILLATLDINEKLVVYEQESIKELPVLE
jgi:uncharacterized membrane protein YcaP (DUF421 family)